MADWFKASLATGPHNLEGELQEENNELFFSSRRSPVLCRNACVASSQPLASSIGLDLLRQGANAAETAVAVAAALAVTEPCSTGLGGDMFCLYYDSQTRRVSCINGSGKSAARLRRQDLLDKYPNGKGGIDASKYRESPHAVTVPGAAQGWEDVLKRYGTGQFSLADLVEPAAVLAEEGFPVAPITAHHWKSGMPQISQWISKDGAPVPMTTNGKDAPEAGQIFTNPHMARVLRELGEHGAAQGFYQGTTGQAIVDVIQRHGGCMTMEDFKAHESTFPQAISADYRGCKLWQVPPNGQGVAGLIALTGLAQLEERTVIAKLDKDSIGSADAYHAMIEMMRLGFADIRAHVADPECMKVSNDWLVDKERIGNRAESLFRPDKAVIDGIPDASSCTVSFQVVDKQGNAISFVNSNYTGFGSGIVPDGCGFTLQNRGFGFTLNEVGHPNAVAPSKRPYHTIIPGMITHADTDELYATISNMGGNMQPQGHLQLTVDLLAGNLDPQAAIDTPRFCIVAGTQSGVVLLEEGIDEKVLDDLHSRGHKMLKNTSGHERAVFGRAQIIKRDRATGVLWAGSDGRADGCAMGF